MKLIIIVFIFLIGCQSITKNDTPKNITYYINLFEKEGKIDSNYLKLLNTKEVLTKEETILIKKYNRKIYSSQKKRESFINSLLKSSKNLSIIMATEDFIFQKYFDDSTSKIIDSELVKRIKKK